MSPRKPVAPEEDRQNRGLLDRTRAWDRRTVRRVVPVSLLAGMLLMAPAHGAQQLVYGVVGTEVAVSFDARTGNVRPAANLHVSVTVDRTPTGSVTTIVPQP